MAFLDELSDKIINTSKTAVSKAKEVADITKLKTEIISEETKIKSVYTEIGKLFCEKAAQDVDPEFQPLLEQIAVCKAAIAEYKAEIFKIKGTQQCQECGAEMAGEAQFCSACGAPMPPKNTTAEEKEPLNEEDIVEADGQEDAGCGCGCEDASEEEGCCCKDAPEEGSCGCENTPEEEGCCCNSHREE